MKILSIGNSFSADAHAYLHTLATQRGEDLETVNLAIGGCSLQTHWENVVQNNANYLHSINGGEWEKELATIEQILKSERFDAITLQQVSHFSGQSETYQPYLNDLIEYVRKFQPSADLYIHRTWAYEIDSQHEGFLSYDRDQVKMYKAIVEATELACLTTGATLIPAGDVIQALRSRVPKFDYANGKESLCCDGFHMSHTYGRYAVAMTWLATFTGKKVAPVPFMELDDEIIAKICDIVNEIVFRK
ncbi:MAG: DUF4886 domain-containing protein [Clostridia bacterium]|nr:DUF4886 domain-containing protein [Clostridia bacterium]